MAFSVGLDAHCLQRKANVARLDSGARKALVSYQIGEPTSLSRAGKEALQVEDSSNAITRQAALRAHPEPHMGNLELETYLT